MYCSTSSRIIIGLDCGTSSTGVSIYLVEGETVIRGANIEWPCGGDELKLPSRIAYRVDNRSFTAYSFTKLFLDSNAELAEFDDQILQQTASLGNPDQNLHPDRDKPPVDVVADYLSNVLNFVWEALQQDSETAAKGVLAQLKEEGMLQAGDGILVCDCGGGTVVITTYFVMDHTNCNLLGITAVQGAKCGGAAIDSRLFNLMKRRLPEHTFKRLNHLIGPGSEFMERFETLKRSFGSSNDQNPSYLPLPIRIGREACGMGFDKGTGEFILTVEDVQSLFDPVVHSVIDLVNSQIEAAGREYGRPVINKIVLVGGLALSPYLQRALHQCFEVPGRLCITVTPQDPIMAVSNGSVLLSPCKLDVRSPRHYGLGSPSRQGAEEIEWINFMVSFTQFGRISPTLLTKVHQGQQYQQGPTDAHKHPRPYYLYQAGDARVMTIPLYSYEPSSPRHTAESNDVTLAGLIVADFSGLDLDIHNEERLNNRMLYKLNYLVEFIFDATNGALHFTVQAHGRVIGELSLQLRFWELGIADGMMFRLIIQPWNIKD
ncbi:actin-like ATPase domain-containing protein [Penicillium viridicatum]|nr:actin-like ATPase domain-containing protein [Penicillium viridicatum]